MFSSFLVFTAYRNSTSSSSIPGTGSSATSATVNHTPAYPREICVRALELGATALILVHDHPSGEPSPSRSDIDMTNRIGDAAKLIDVALHDHIIVTPTAAFSFREKGLL